MIVSKCIKLNSNYIEYQINIGLVCPISIVSALWDFLVYTDQQKKMYHLFSKENVGERKQSFSFSILFCTPATRVLRRLDLTQKASFKWLHVVDLRIYGEREGDKIAISILRICTIDHTHHARRAFSNNKILFVKGTGWLYTIWLLIWIDSKNPETERCHFDER